MEKQEDTKSKEVGLEHLLQAVEELTSKNNPKKDSIKRMVDTIYARALQIKREEAEHEDSQNFIDNGIIDSHEMTARNHLKQKLPHPCKPDFYEKHIYEPIQRAFGITLPKGCDFGHVYLTLEQRAEGRGKLTSYGLTHLNYGRAPNPHGFYVVAEYERLNRLFARFQEEGGKELLQHFVGDVFGWNQHKKDRTANPYDEVNIFVDMKEAHFKIL